MGEEDQPPQHIWLDPDELEQHFDRVHERWKNPSSGGMEPIDDTSFTQNELTANLRR